MRLSKAARATQRKWSPEEIEQAKQESRWCDACQRGFRNANGMRGHVAHAHSAKEPEPEAVLPVSPASPSDYVTFRCMKAPQLRIVFKPARQKLVETGVGGQNQFAPGIEVQFQAGMYRTKNPKIIAFLEGDLAECERLGVLDDYGEPRCYHDPRYPIISSRQMLDRRKLTEIGSSLAIKPKAEVERMRNVDGRAGTSYPILAEGEVPPPRY